MNNVVAALALTAIIVLIISFFGSQTGYVTEPNAANLEDNSTCPPCESESDCPECPESECPEDTTPYAECDSCCDEYEDCIDFEGCEDCPGCPEPPSCLPEANEENCQQYCGEGGNGEEIIQPNITHIQYTGENKLDEWVQIEGSGTDMTNWTLSDLANHTYIFPVFVIDGIVRVHTDSGTENQTDLFWGSGTAIWNNDGDTATLKDQEGNTISIYEY